MTRLLASEISQANVLVSVRVSAKELTSLILDEERLRAERHDRKLWKSRVTGLDDYGGASGFGSDPPRRKQDRRRGENEEDDLEYRLAIEASKNEADEDKKRRDQGSRAETVPDDDDLAKAIKLSKEEEELRRKELENNNAASLFDDAPTQPSQPQATGWNQGYQQQGAVDWFGNPVDQQQQQQQQQPQSTGFLNNMYSQPQQTGFQNGYGYNPYQQPMQTGFDQSQMQNQSQTPQTQQSYVQPQQTAFAGNNPYAQPANGFGFQNQQQQPLQQQEAAPQPGSQNPWASNSLTQDSVRPQPTGSNNPFASSLNNPQPTSTQRQPSLYTLSEQKTQTPFSPLNSQGYQQQAPFSHAQSQPQVQQQQQQQQPQQQAQLQQQSTQSQNPHHAQLNALLASGEGQDTFGNTGDLRLPAQHTAPGTFVNSAGSGLARLPANQTGAGNNPFFQSQPTGMPQQQQRMAPAQTGPANGFSGGGFGASNNPFGAQQRPAQQQQGGSLIDL